MCSTAGSSTGPHFTHFTHLLLHSLAIHLNFNEYISRLLMVRLMCNYSEQPKLANNPIAHRANEATTPKITQSGRRMHSAERQTQQRQLPLHCSGGFKFSILFKRSKWSREGTRLASLPLPRLISLLSFSLMQSTFSLVEADLSEFFDSCSFFHERASSSKQHHPVCLLCARY